LRGRENHANPAGRTSSFRRQGLIFVRSDFRHDIRDRTRDERIGKDGFLALLVEALELVRAAWLPVVIKKTSFPGLST
jgi:hypothetical protein